MTGGFGIPTFTSTEKQRFMKKKSFVKKTMLALTAGILVVACTGEGNRPTVYTGSGKGARGSLPGIAVPTSNQVPVEEARHLVANYAPKAGVVVREGDTLPDTRAIWFGLEELEQMVAQVRHEGGDGVRFYLATYDADYPADSPAPDIPPADYWGYNTLLMVSTRDSVANGEHFHRDYFPEGPAQAQGFMVAASILNHGSICPPWLYGNSCRDIGAMLF